MTDETRVGTGDELAQAQAALARQAAEIEQLRAQLADEQFGRELREVFALATTAGTIAAPTAHGQILTSLVETAADVIGAHSAALFMIDDQAGELVFEVALGPKADEAMKHRVPLGQGIAGLVAMSGQPMAVSGAESDPRQASDIAARIGYLPRSILCVPLVYGDQVIGVLEMLDKVGAPSFSPRDMELLGLFANQAAVGIEMSRTVQSLPALIGEVLHVLDDQSEDPRVQQLREDAQALARRIEADPTYRQALEMARLVQEISRESEHAGRHCLTILRSFAEYSRARAGTASDFWPRG